MSQEIARLHATVGADTNELHSKLNQASRGIDTFRRETESAGSGVQSFFDRVASTAGGVIAANLFGQLTSQVTGFIKSAISATAELQYMEVGITGLLAREISKGELVTETYQVMTRAAGGQAGANKKLMDSQTSLTSKVADYTSHLAIAQQKLVELGAKKKVSESQWMSAQHVVETYTQKLQGAQAELGGVNAKLTDQAAATMAVSTATREMYVNQTSISEAYPEAQARAKGLMDELAKLAIVSPYQLEMVNSTFKTAMAFGYTSKEAMSYTKALLNVAAGTGATNEMLHRMAYNFAQIRMVGQVTKMDLRQLAMAGFDLSAVLQFTGEKFGILIEDHADFNKAIASGKITWQQFTEAFAEYADVNFGKASEIMSTTVMGLQSTFHDVFALTMPKVVRPALEEVNARLTSMLNIFMDVRESGVLEDVGSQLGQTVTRWMKPIDTVLKSVTRFRDIQSQLKIPNLLPDLQHQLGGEMAALSGGGGMVGVLAKAIFGDETGGKIVTGIKWVKTHLQDIKAVVIGFGVVFAGLKIIGIVGAIISTLAALLTPIGLLITVSGLLVAAWIRDWGGIRTAVTGFWEKTGKPIFEKVKTWAEVAIPQALTTMRTAWDTAVAGIGNLWERVKAAYKEGGISGVLQVIGTEASSLGAEIVGKIRDKVAELWPQVTASLGNLGEMGQHLWGQIATWWEGTEIPGEFGMIVTPGAKEEAKKLGAQLWEAIETGIRDAVASWVDVTAKIKTWAESEETQRSVFTAGETIGGWLADKVSATIVEALSSQATGDSLGTAVGTGLGKGIANVQTAAAAFGSALAGGIVSGIAAKFEDPDTAKDIGRSIATFLVAVAPYMTLLGQMVFMVSEAKRLAGELGKIIGKEIAGPQETAPGYVPGAARGADFIARIPQLIRVGEGKYPERVTVTPLTGGGGGGQPIINVYIQGPVTQPQQAREQAKIGVLEGLRARGLA